MQGHPSRNEGEEKGEFQEKQSCTRNGIVLESASATEEGSDTARRGIGTGQLG